jgi:YcxB-like protein
MTGQAGAHFVFEINEDDDRIYRKLSLKDLRRYLDRRILKGIPLAVFVCLLAALLVAFAYDLLPSSAVLCAEGTFAVAYLAALVAGNIAQSRFGQTMFRDMPATNRHFDCTFDDNGIVVKNGLREGRTPWRAIFRIDDAPSMVIFQYQPGLGFFLPHRVFVTHSARADFLTWAAARVRAAAQPTTAGSGA